MSKMQKIERSDLKTVSITVDKVGQVFFYQDRILRAINDTHTQSVSEMFSCGLVAEIIKQNYFPKTSITDFEIEGFSTIIEHERIDSWNYPYEWSFNMLKDAALMVLELNELSNKFGYEIHDAHAFNVVFNAGSPQYFDFGSFVKIDKDKKKRWSGFNCFFNHFLMPLRLKSLGYSNTATSIFLMRNYFDEQEFFRISHPVISMFNFRSSLFKISNLVRRLALASEDSIRSRIKNAFFLQFILFAKRFLNINLDYKQLTKLILSFEPPNRDTMWKNYHNEIDPESNLRFQKIAEIIRGFSDADSLTELGANQGKFASYLCENTQLKRVLATDYDEEAVDIMYLSNKRKEKLLPLVLDVVRSNGRIADEPIFDRLTSDIVMALALTHHLILTQGTPIDYILRALRALTKKYVIVEFMPLGLYSPKSSVPELPGYYTLEWFRSNFTDYFNLLSEASLEINRYVFVGKVK